MEKPLTLPSPRGEGFPPAAVVLMILGSFGTGECTETTFQTPAHARIPSPRGEGRVRGVAFFFALFAAALTILQRSAVGASAPDYSAVQRLFTEHCLDCHSSQEPEAKLVLESFESLMKGGENGPALVPSQSSNSLLIQMVEGKVERGGKQKIMPPGKRAKLTPDEIGVIRAWIDGGAHSSSSPAALASAPAIPKIKPRVAPRQSIHAAAFAKTLGVIALGRDGNIDLVSAGTHHVRSTIAVDSGSVNSLAFSTDGKFLFGAGGEPGLFGRAWQWRVSDWTLVRAYIGHKDALYALALSPDGKVLATGGYDQKIKLWDTQSGAELKSLSGHTGAIFALSFRPDGQLLASGSADRTVKLWDVASGQRRDTLSQSLKEINAVAFSADGQRLYAAGGDNRVRVWSISEKAAETTNPFLDARFAHEGAILALAFSPDGKLLATSGTDRAIKLWDTTNLTERIALELQPDWSPALTFVSGGGGAESALLAGRIDGTFKLYDSASGQPLAPPKPELSRIQPRGIERGTSGRFVLTGTQLAEATEVLFSKPGLSAVLEPSSDADAKSRAVQITVAGEVPPGPCDVRVHSPPGRAASARCTSTIFGNSTPRTKPILHRPGLATCR